MSLKQELPGLLKRAIKRHQVPGATIAVMRNGRITATAAAGVTSLENKVRVTEDTVFQIGSITKPFTTTLAMQLVDDGMLDLDTPVQHYLPGFRVADLGVSREVTARHLLSHQSGIDGDFFVDSGRGDDNIARIVDMATMIPSLFPIGEKLSYCNLGFAIMGRVIEVLTGNTWDQVLQERIFNPLDMQHAFSQPEQAIRYSCAIGHVQSQSRKGVWHASKIPYLALGQKAAGATPSMSVLDLMKFARLHLDGGVAPDGTRLMRAGSVKAMQRRQIRAPKHTPHSITGWGLGWMLMDWNGKKLFGHDGGTIGQSSFLRILPEKNMAVAMLTNGGDTAGLFYDMFTEAFATARTAPSSPPAIDRDIDVDAVPLCGTYSNLNQSLQLAMGRNKFELSLVPNGAADPIQTVQLGFIDKETARFDTGDTMMDRNLVKFSDYVDGMPQYLALGLRQYRRVS